MDRKEKLTTIYTKTGLLNEHCGLNMRRLKHILCLVLTTLIASGSYLPDYYGPAGYGPIWFEWQPSSTPDVFYRLLGSHHSFIGGQFRSAEISISCGTALRRVIMVPSIGTWYFVVVATRGNEWSPPSNEVTVKITGTPEKVKIGKNKTDEQ